MYRRFMSELVEFMIEAGIATPSSIRGCTDTEIEQLELSTGFQFPRALRAWLAAMGHECGSLADGDNLGYSGFDEASHVALQLTTASNSQWSLPDAALPFVQHQGYQFTFVYPQLADDPEVWLYMDTDPAPCLLAFSLSGWLREAAIWAVESKPRNDETCREIRSNRERWLERKLVLDGYSRQLSDLRGTFLEKVLDSDRQHGHITGPCELQELWNDWFVTTSL